MQIHLDKLQAELFFLFLCFWACQSENRPISVLWAGGGRGRVGRSIARVTGKQKFSVSVDAAAGQSDRSRTTTFYSEEEQLG